MAIRSRRAPTETSIRGGTIIRRARLRTGVSQRELASRLGTSQSLVARWEPGTVEPPFSTVVEAVRACGLDLGLGLVEYDIEHDDLILENLTFDPATRLARMLGSLETIRSLGRGQRKR